MDIINKLILWVGTLTGYYKYFDGFYYPSSVGYDKHQVANMFNSGMSLGEICRDACRLTTKCRGISCKKCMFNGPGKIVLLEFLQHEGLVEKNKEN